MPFQEISAQQLKDESGVLVLNEMLRALFDSLAGDENTVKIYKGYGTPESNVAAGIGSLYQRLDGGSSTTLYVKESGTGDTGWVAK